MKLMNFRSLDPAYTSSGRKGLTRISKGDVEVWKEFACTPDRLQQTAVAIRDAIFNRPPQDDTDEQIAAPGLTEAPEGRLLTYQHHRRERNPRLAQERKRQALAKTGHLACEACGLNPVDRYGDRGSGAIEVHHTKPLHLLREGDRTRLEDLAILCANCHRVVHASKPWLAVEELRR